MCTKRKVSLLLGILLVLISLLGGNVYSGEKVVYAQAAEPTLQVEINHNWIVGRNWPAGNEVTLTIEDLDTPLSPDYTGKQIATADSWGTGVSFNSWRTGFHFDVKPGHIVTLTDGETTKTHTALDLWMTKVDFSANTVEGYADPWRELNINIGEPCYEYLTVQTNGDGYWVANFICNLSTVEKMNAEQFGFDDTVSTRFGWQPPHFQVDISQDWVWGVDWLPGSVVNLTIDDPDVPGTENYTDTQIVPADLELGVDFYFASEYDVEPGHIVTVTDGGITEIYEVEYLDVYEVNPDTDMIKGGAEPGKELEVSVWGPDGTTVFVDSDAVTGEWEVDFSGIADITTESFGNVRSTVSWDENHTQYIWRAPMPTTPLLDDFNRADGRIGSNWTGNKSKYRIKDNQLRVRSNDSNSDIYWYEEFGADQEAYFTFAKINETAAEQDLLLKSQSKRTWGDGVIEVLYDAPGHNVQVWTWEWPQGWVKYGDDMPVTFMVGDTFKARARAEGIVEVYRNGELLDTRDVSTWSYYAEGGYIGLWFIGAENAMIDDFGGGTVP